MRSILVTRPQPVADEFAEKLRREGFHVYVAPLMEYVDVDVSLEDLSRYQACVFTSAQAVQVFARKSSHRGLPVLAVGDQTAAAARQAGFTKVYSADGDSEDVIALIRDRAEDLSLKRILHPCSDDTPADIGKAAARLGIKMDLRTIYKANFITKFPDDVSHALKENAIDTITLFSARTASNLVELMQKKQWHGMSKRMDVVCISKRVAAELKPLTWRTVRVCDNPKTESIIDLLKKNDPYRNIESSFINRRERPDRRQNRPPKDEGGNIRADSYAGPDRRTGIDRRAHMKRQQERVMEERMKFLNSTLIGSALIFTAVVLVGALLMGPEYFRFGLTSPAAAPTVPAQKTAEAAEEPFSLGAFINRQIEKFRTGGDIIADTAHQLAGPVSFRDGAGPAVAQMLDRLDTLRNTPRGTAAVDTAMTRLRALVSQSSGDPKALGAALKEAERHDKTLGALLGQYGWKDLAAAGMLLTLSEFRSNVGSSRPYAEDLNALRQFAGDDPEMNRALQRLSPYAEKGIKTREALQDEFNGFAKDIISATVEGRDVSVRDAALKRFDNFSNAVNVSQIQGQSPEAVTARAKLMLKQGNVKGAMKELRSLRGASADTAEPWMESAAGYVVADQSSDALTRRILQTMPGSSSLSAEGILSVIKNSINSRSVTYMSPALQNNGGNYGGVMAPSPAP